MRIIGDSTLPLWGGESRDAGHYGEVDGYGKGSVGGTGNHGPCGLRDSGEEEFLGAIS